MEEVLVYQMTQLIDELPGANKEKKAQLSMGLIALLFLYLDGIGISHEEMYQYFERYRHFEDS